MALPSDAMSVRVGAADAEATANIVKKTTPFENIIFTSRQRKPRLTEQTSISISPS
jgi:hypothetical protein